MHINILIALLRLVLMETDDKIKIKKIKEMLKLYRNKRDVSEILNKIHQEYLNWEFRPAEAKERFLNNINRAVKSLHLKKTSSPLREPSLIGRRFYAASPLENARSLRSTETRETKIPSVRR